MILVCSAWEEEIKYLRGQLAADNELNRNVLLRPLGIGFLDAALSLEKLLNEIEHHGKNQIEHILFIGTAGAYDPKAELAKLVSVNSVELLNIGTKLEKSYVPENLDNGELRSCSKDSMFSFDDLEKAKCLCSLEITKDCFINFSERGLRNDENRSLVKLNEDLKNERNEVMGSLGNSLESMELYGVAKVAHDHKIPWTAVLGITNTISENAHSEWKANHKAVSKKLCKAVLCKLKTLNLVST